MPAPPTLHTIFLQLGFKDDNDRESAFRALVEAFLVQHGFRAGERVGASDVSISKERVECLSCSFLQRFGSRLWPGGSNIGHLVRYTPAIHRGKHGIYRMRFDGRMAHNARQAFRKREGYLARPSEVEVVAFSRLGVLMQRYLRRMVIGTLASSKTPTEELLLAVLSVAVQSDERFSTKTCKEDDPKEGSSTRTAMDIDMLASSVKGSPDLSEPAEIDWRGPWAKPRRNVKAEAST